MLRFCITEGLYLHDEMGRLPGWEAAGSILYHGRLGMDSGTGNGMIPYRGNVWLIVRGGATATPMTSELRLYI